MKQHAQWEASMRMIKSTSKIFAGIFVASLFAVGGSGAASAQTVTANFTFQNAFGSTITLDTASCTPGASISPTFSISNGGTGNATATMSASSGMCTVRYQSGSFGCQFQIFVNSINGFTGFNAYKGSGGRPSCTSVTESGSGGTYNATFKMQ